MTKNHVEDIINTWKKDGNKIHPSDPKLPLHPELIYRIKGSWTTWNDFLKTEKNSPYYNLQIEQDALENQAWLQYREVFRPQGE